MDSGCPESSEGSLVDSQSQVCVIVLGFQEEVSGAQGQVPSLFWEDQERIYRVTTKLCRGPFGQSEHHEEEAREEWPRQMLCSGAFDDDSLASFRGL